MGIKRKANKKKERQIRLQAQPHKKEIQISLATFFTIIEVKLLSIVALLAEAKHTASANLLLHF